MEQKGPVEFFLVDPVAPLHLAVVLGRPRPYELVRDSMGLAVGIQQARGVLPVLGPGLGESPVGEFRPVVGLQDARPVAEEGHGGVEGPYRLEHRMLVGVIEEPLPGRLVQDRVLVIGLVARELRRLAFRGDELDVHLPLVAGVIGRVVFLAMPLGVRLVRRVSIESFQLPQNGHVAHRKAGLGVGLHPDLNRGHPVGLGFVEQAFDLVGGPLGDRGRMRAFRAVWKVAEGTLAPLVVPFEPAIKRGLLHMVVLGDLPDRPAGLPDPLAAMKPGFVGMRPVIPLRDLW